MTGGLWSEAREVLVRDRLAMACAALLVLLALAAVAGPSLLDYREDEIDWTHMAAPPFEAPGHWLGTDRLGRDLLVRTLLRPARFARDRARGHARQPRDRRRLGRDRGLTGAAARTR